MATNGKLEVEIEVKSNADKFWSIIKDSASIFPKAFPNDYKSIEILEGDGNTVGSVRLVTFGEGSPFVKINKEKIDDIDDSKRTLTYSVIDGDLLKYFKQLKSHLSVTPKGDGSLVKWSSEYEKDSQEVPEPEIIKEFAVNTFLKVDEYILNA
ncbi:MLP-like protein 423 [Cicer arietinum]|uniref:MLP-like protein 423 n=1 Tax=Cicer arietinum TaxID=3827 RepID=A0A1S2YTX0_CICAR|nr:MLP-like protein 423 [Cicer arietinum]